MQPSRHVLPPSILVCFVVCPWLIPNDYYVRGEQADGELVWISPMRVTYTGT